MSQLLPFNLTPINKIERAVMTSRQAPHGCKLITPCQSSPYYWDAAEEGVIDRGDLITLLKYCGVASTPSTYYSQTETILRRLIERKTLIENAEDVRDYLISHTGLEMQIFAAIESVVSNIGPKAVCLLKVYHDHEINDHYLTLYVRNIEYPIDFIEKLEHIQEISSAFSKESTGHLLVTTDFEYPMV